MGNRPNMDSDNRMQVMADYIIEGIPLNLQYSSNYILLNLDIKEGDNLDRSDSSFVIIGENASEYFKTDSNGNVPRPRNISMNRLSLNSFWLRFLDMFPVLQRLLHYIL